MASTPSTQTLPDTPVPKKTFGLSDIQPNHTSAPIQSCHELGPPSPPLVSHIGTPSIQLQPTDDHDSDGNLAVPHSGEDEDEYTLSAYGDISLGEVVVPPLPASAYSSTEPLQPRVAQPRLRLKVQRPPMPKCRQNYYVLDPMPYNGGMEANEHWPSSPSPIEHRSPWTQHQPLVSPLPVCPTNFGTEENKPVKRTGSSLEKFFDELLPRSPSIQLSPPGSPARQALCLPQETREQKSGAQQGRKMLEANDAVKLPQSTPVPVQAKPKPTPWRTRLPPRLPIPKWDI